VNAVTVVIDPIKTRFIVLSSEDDPGQRRILSCAALIEDRVEIVQGAKRLTAAIMKALTI
jgi:hypothetical protein